MLSLSDNVIKLLFFGDRPICKMDRVLNNLSEILSGYHNFVIKNVNNNPTVYVHVPDVEYYSQIRITQSTDPEYNVTIAVIFTVDDDEHLHAEYNISILKEVVITKVNHTVLQQPHVIAQYDEQLGINIDDSSDENAYTILRAHQDLFENILYLCV